MRLSLRLRLAIWYGALTGSVVALFCIYSYAVHSRAHYEELDSWLQGAARHVAAELAATPPGDAQRVLRASELLGVGARRYDTAGRVTAESHAANATPAFDPKAVLRRPSQAPYPAIAVLAPAFSLVDRSRGRFTVLADTSTRRWRAFVVPLAGDGYFAAMVPLTQIDVAVRWFGRLMVSMAIIGATLTFAIAWWLAGRALRPVATLTEAASAIARRREFSRRVVVSGRDELGRLAATFNDMLASLDHAYAAQQRFITDASHELRAPLTIVRANLELLDDSRLTPDDRVQALLEARRETERLSRLVGDLLILARAEAGITLSVQPVELDRIVMDVLSEARHLGHGRELVLETIEPCIVRGDPDRLKQLLLILVDNAVKYTPDGGRVRVGLVRDGPWVVVTIADTGIGMAHDELAHAFDRFYRADAARARDPGGAGLGLSIAEWIAGRHGGSVELDSTPGQGTNATVRLPVMP